MSKLKGVKLKQLFWQKEETLNIFERSVRFHHRLVKIHPFINGNGRHARLVSDIYWDC